MLGSVVAGGTATASPVLPNLVTSAFGAPSSDSAVAERSVFGLPTDLETMNRLAQGADVGTATWGIPLTAAEEAQLDLVGRMTFVSELDKAVFPYLRSLPTLAGSWIDQVNNGGPVVALTTPDPSVEQHVRSLMPLDSRGIEFRVAKNTLAALTAAADAARGTWAQLAPSLSLRTVSVDTMANAIQLGVAPADLAASQADAGAVQSKLGVPVSIIADQGGGDAACTSRKNCYSPMKAGIQIASGTAAHWWCTMGFHIVMNSDGAREFLTAGHCGWNQSVYWYHNIYAGMKSATWYVQNGEDVMRVNFGSDAQASSMVYGEPDAIMSSVREGIVVR